MEVDITHEKPLTLQGKLPSAALSDSSFINENSRHEYALRPEQDEIDSKRTFLRDAGLDVTEKEIQDDTTKENLLDRVNNGDAEAKFLLGQFYFARKEYCEAKAWFEEIQGKDWQAKYQLAVMKFDGLGIETDYVINFVFIANSSLWF